MPTDYKQLRDQYKKMQEKNPVTAPPSVSAASSEGTPKSPTSTFGLWHSIASAGKQVASAQNNFLVGQLKGVASTVASAASLGEKALNSASEKLFPSIGIHGSDETTGKKIKDRIAPDGTAQKIGFGSEQIGEFFVPVGGAGKVEKIAEGTGLLSKTPKLVKGAVELGKKALLEGAEQGTRAALQEGDINKNVATAAVLGSATELAAKPISSIADKIGNAIFSLAVPTSPLQRAKDAKKMLDVGKAISGTGVSISRKSLLQKIGEDTQFFGKKLESVIDKATKDKGYATYSIDDVANQVEEHLNAPAIAKQMQLSPVDVSSARKAVQERLDQYKEMFAGKDLNLSDVQKLKIDLGNGLETLYKKALDAPVKAKALTDITLQSKLRQIIKDQVPAADKLNKKLAPLLEASGRLENKGSYSGYLTDIISGTMAAGSAGDILSDPVGYMKRFATGVIAKRLGTSTASYTLAGTLFKDVAKIAESPQFLQVVRRLFELSSQEGEEEVTSSAD